MSVSSKSPLKIIKAAHATARAALPEYSHRFSPKKFTQAQLFACLVLKMFFKTDFRGLESILKDSPNLRHAIEMKEVPHFTTLQKAEQRLLKHRQAQQLLEKSIFFGAE